MSSSTGTLQTPRGAIQEGQYVFPYHYLPAIGHGGHFSRHREMAWGFEYLCYLNHARNIVNELSPTSVLEVGCGDGRFLGMLSGSGRRLVGSDLSERAIGFAKAFNPAIEFHALDAAELDEQFQLVAAVEVLEHIADDHVSSFLNVLCDRTALGGHVLITVPTTVARLNKKHYRHYTRELFEQQVQTAGVQLEIEKIEYIYREPAWLWCAMRLMTNPVWSVHVNAVENMIWSLVWRKYRVCTPRTGRHLIALLRKSL